MILEAVDKKISIFDISHLLLKNWIKIVVGILVGMVAGYIWWSFGTAYGIQITLVRTNIGETQTIRYIPVQKLKTLLPEIAAKELSEKELSEKHNSKYIKNLYKILSNELWWDKNLQELDKDNIFSKSKEKEDIQKKTSSNAWRIRFYDKSFKELNGTINFIDEFFLSRSAYIELSNLIENLKRKSSDVYAESAALYLDEIDKNIADLRTDIIQLINIKSGQNDSSKQSDILANNVLLIEMKKINIFYLNKEKSSIINELKNRPIIFELVAEIEPLLGSNYDGIMLIKKIITILSDKIGNSSENSLQKINYQKQFIMELRGISNKYTNGIEKFPPSILPKPNLVTFIIRGGIIGFLIIFLAIFSKFCFKKIPIFE